MSAQEILPTRSQFDPSDPVVIEVRGATGGELTVWHLGDEVMRKLRSRGSMITLGRLPEGSYGVEYSTGSGTIRTAVSVTSKPSSRLRYGFVVDYSPARDLVGVSDTVRRLHLTGVQFYDWAYRHANLLGGGESYLDALTQPISLQTVRDVIGAVQAAGATALGYAAVYAVGPDEWAKWQHRALLTATGQPYALGDFLFLVDPASPDWLESFTGQLRHSVDELGFDGFHLDQYGYPKRAVRADGESVDVADSFVTLIDAVRDALPSSQLVFNNVNDFPTWATAEAPQDAVYIEVWEPSVSLGSLASVVSRARAMSAGKPVVIAAYQHVYDSAPVAEADRATSFTMATLFSHGATQLLAGEADRILVDPYYVRNHIVERSTEQLLKRWYDFLVENDEVLQSPSIVDVTSSYAGAYNDDCEVAFDSIETRGDARAGSVWRRITSVDRLLVVHLINLVGQGDELWDAPRAIPRRLGAGTLRFRRVGLGMPRVRVADPDRSPRFVDVEVTLDGDFATASLPEPHIWQVVLIELEVAS